MTTRRMHIAQRRLRDFSRIVEIAIVEIRVRLDNGRGGEEGERQKKRNSGSQEEGFMFISTQLGMFGERFNLRSYT